MNGSETVFKITLACMPPIDKKPLLSGIVTNHSDFALSLEEIPRLVWLWKNRVARVLHLNTNLVVPVDQVLGFGIFFVAGVNSD